MRIRAVGFGVTGAGREKNDDHYCIGPFVEQDTLTTLCLDSSSAAFRQYGLLAAVADGLGGYAGGSTASQVALEVLSAQFYGEKRTGCSEEDYLGCLHRYLEQTQQVLIRYLQRAPELSEAGTTLTGIVLAPPDLQVVFHIGDSRALRFSAGYLRPLTVDHTPVGPDASSGRLTEAEALRVPGGGALLRSLGMHGSVQPDWSVEHAAAPGNQYFIGTDGWHGLGRGLSQREIQQIARQGEDAETLTRHMVRAAVGAGSQDDATLIVVQLSEDEQSDGR